MSADKPWPLMYRDLTRQPADLLRDAFDGLGRSLEHLECGREAVWRCHELDRSDAAGAPVFPASARELSHFASETIDRFGYDYAHRFVLAVIRKDDLDEEHASLIANVRRRFGPKGLLYFAGFLAVQVAAENVRTGRWSL